MRQATSQIAAGDYTARVPVPGEVELAELATDVNTLGLALEQTEGRRMRLIGEVAHEMRTPLTVLDGYVEGMIDDVIPANPENLGQLGVETRRLRRLADDLSSLSRTEEGRLSLTQRRVDLADVVREAASRLGPQADDVGVRLDIRAGSGPFAVDVDVDRIAQVVTNLIGNAIRATPSGGTITVTCTRRGEKADASVADTGEGIAAEHLDRIFERFYRVPGRRSGESDSGSGIGLTIARSIARGHGGDLTAASPGPGQGSTFTLTLPLAPQV